MSNTTMLDLKSYPAYKPSESQWIGDVPTHWRTTSIKRVTNTGSGGTPPTGERKYYGGGIPWITTSELREQTITDTSETITAKALSEIASLKMYPKGSIAIAMYGATIGRLGILGTSAAVNQACCVCQPSQLMESRFLFYWLLASRGNLSALGQGGGQPNLNQEIIREFPICLPPLDEQTAIVRHLDDADQRIRAYVSAKERLIALLEEEKQTVIHQAVTRGLDPNVKLKPSGVEWLGDVPEHWEIQQLKQKSRIVRGKFTHRPRNDASLYDGPYPFIQTGDIARSGKWITTYEQTLNERGLAVSQIFPKGTLVMTIAANIGDVAILDLDACFPDSVVGFTPSHNVDRDYLYNLFQSMKTEFLRVAPVNTQGNLNVERIGATIVAFPPLAEQIAIAAHLNRLEDGIGAAIDRARRQIELMEEYRTRLIADVVTGKLDVRGI